MVSLTMSDFFNYPSPKLVVDCVVFGFTDDKIKILLSKRNIEPFLNCWALPGGAVFVGESVEEAATRKLIKEGGLKAILEQHQVYSNKDRDPRGHVVSVAFSAFVKPTEVTLVKPEEAKESAWFDIDKLPDMAFDHKTIVKDCQNNLKHKLNNIGKNLLPKTFTLAMLQKLYEVINGKKLDKPNFRKLILASNIIEGTGKKIKGTRFRSPELFKFKS